MRPPGGGRHVASPSIAGGGGAIALEKWVKLGLELFDLFLDRNRFPQLFNAKFSKFAILRGKSVLSPLPCQGDK